MTDTLQLVMLVAVVVLFWDRFSKKSSTTTASGNKTGSLQDRIAQMIEEEGIL